jgi:hypothetical protein
MATIPSRPRLAVAAFWSAFVPSLVLLALALLAGELVGTAAARRACPFWVATALLAPALALYLLRRDDPPGPYWLAFWAAAFLAFVAYLAWSLALFPPAWIAGGDLWPPDAHTLGLVLAAWWGLDVLAALAGAADPALRLARGLLCLLLLLSFLALNLLGGFGVGSLLGLALLTAVFLGLLGRLFGRQHDPASLTSRLIAVSFAALNRVVAWHWLPRYLGALNLEVYRDVLRAKNLHNTRAPAIPENPPPVQPLPNPEYLARRSSDGTWNDLKDPLMGAAHTRFGRNVPLEHAFPELEPALLGPSPRVVSNRLLARPEGTFVPATTLNLLAAAWIQFMTHDWFHHGTPPKERPFRVPLDLPRADRWLGGEAPMEVRRTPPDPTHPEYPDFRERKYPPTYLNDGTHWWDGSQVYGNTEAETAALRVRDGEGPAGDLRLAADRLLPIDPQTQSEQAGLVDNWWLGLSLMHTLFAQEHNAIAARLRLEYPYWGADRIFHTARLVNTALMAKIHSVEWTPAILSHPTIDVALNGNWAGVLPERVARLLGRFSDSDFVCGIPGSDTDHHGAPFALTEEFVAVYRLHALLPESLKLYRARDGSFVKEAALADLLFEKVRGALDVGAGERLTLDDVCYSFGITHPGLPVLHNFPNFLRNLRKADPFGGPDQVLDLATIDVLRDRERGVPRYNQFRRLFHLPPVTSFEALTSNRKWAEELREVYGDVERVDLQVGMAAEDFPEGFGFSETAFRVFILMASRRLKSDRFLATDYNATVYSQAGLDWVEDNTMSSLLCRHFPAVAPVLRQVRNAFAPWPPLPRAS